MSSKESLVGRRFFLRAAGVNLALPILDSLSSRMLTPGHGLSALAASAPVARPIRMVCIGNAFGFHPPSFFPQRAGKDYENTPLLEPLAAHRQDFTLISG